MTKGIIEALDKIAPKHCLQNHVDFPHQFIPRATREYSTDPTFPPLYYLVESKVCPNSGEGFKSKLQDCETFQSEFIGASIEECQDWAKSNWEQFNFIEPCVIAIADERSARDGTLLMSYYCPVVDDPEDLEFEGWGRLPPKDDTWYNFRIEHRAADQFIICITGSPIDTAMETYFGRPEKFTNDAGVFDVFKALSYVRGEGSDQEF